MKTHQQLLSERAAEERRLAHNWLLPVIDGNTPRYLTKDELRTAAMRELPISKKSFDYAWIDVIEKTGRHEWYEPMRRRRKTKN